MTTDLSGKKFGKLTVVQLAPSRGNNRRHWVCRCECGKIAVCGTTNLTRGNSTSCGCSRIKHGMSKTALHHRWRTMLDRCSNPNATQYKDYGGRGLSVCKEWHDFAKFFADMGHPPRGGTIERKDNDGIYCKDNCYWATRREQARNKRTNKIIEYEGRSQTVTDWAIEKGISPRTLFNRLFRAKMTVKDALTAPLYAQQRKKRK